MDQDIKDMITQTIGGIIALIGLILYPAVWVASKIQEWAIHKRV